MIVRVWLAAGRPVDDARGNEPAGPFTRAVIDRLWPGRVDRGHAPADTASARARTGVPRDVHRVPRHHDHPGRPPRHPGGPAHRGGGGTVGARRVRARVRVPAAHRGIPGRRPRPDPGVPGGPGRLHRSVGGLRDVRVPRRTGRLRACSRRRWSRSRSPWSPACIPTGNRAHGPWQRGARPAASRSPPGRYSAAGSCSNTAGRRSSGSTSRSAWPSRRRWARCCRGCSRRRGRTAPGSGSTFPGRHCSSSGWPA